MRRRMHCIHPLSAHPHSYICSYAPPPLVSHAVIHALLSPLPSIIPLATGCTPVPVPVAAVPVIFLIKEEKKLKTETGKNEENPVSACLVLTSNFKKVLQCLSHRILRYVHEVLNVDEKKTNCTVWLKITRRMF